MEPQATPSNNRYRETKVEVALKQVTLGQTVSYLHQIESSDEVLSVKSLRMRTRKEAPDFLDVTFAIDKQFGIKMPVEQWMEDVNEGRASTDDFFIMKNLCGQIERLVADATIRAIRLR